jgi:cytochrome c oxidase subunit 3
MFTGVKDSGPTTISDVVGGTSGSDFPGGRGGGYEPEEMLMPMGPSSEKSRILTAFILLVVAMTFAGLFGAYIVIATNDALEWRPFSLPFQVWVSTFFILASSVTYHRAKVAIDKGLFSTARTWLIVTTAFGGVFIASQLLVWLQLRALGFYLEGNPYTGFFYILTAMHAIHVVGGIVALGSVLLSLGPAVTSEERAERSRSLGNVVGWYWHFMGAIWVLMLALLGFWR